MSERVETSGQTTTSIPQITPLFTSSTATDPSASVSSTVPVSPPDLRLPLKAPERMSVSGSHRQEMDGRLPPSGSTLASICARGALGGTGGFKPVNQAQDSIQRRLQLGVRHGVAQPDPAVVGERGPRYQRDALLLHQLLAEARPRHRVLLPDPVNPEEEIECAVRLHELDARGRGAKA